VLVELTELAVVVKGDERNPKLAAQPEGRHGLARVSEDDSLCADAQGEDQLNLFGGGAVESGSTGGQGLDQSSIIAAFHGCFQSDAEPKTRLPVSTEI
jgi:hypothetical protein